MSIVVDYDREVFPFPGKMKSSVWEYFGFYKDDFGILDKSKAICRLCRRAVNYTGNTTNLRAHVVHHHRGDENVDQKTLLTRSMPISPVNFSAQVGCSIVTPSPLSTTLPQDRLKLNTDISPSKTTVSSALINFIVGELIQIEAVDSEAFRNMVQVLGNNKIEVLVPKADEINAILCSNYYLVKQKVAACLTKAESEYLKVEIWKTLQSNYMTVSVKILNENWKTASYVLNTYDLDANYTSKDVSGYLTKTIQEWGLMDEIIILSDNSQEVTEAASKVSSVHLTSLGVSINKAAGLCIDHHVVASLVTHIREIIHLFQHDTNANIILLEKQRVLKLPNKNLTLCERRNWKSTLEMLEIFDELSAAVMASFNDPNFKRDSTVKMLTPQQQSVVQSVVSMLRPLKTAYSLSHGMKCPCMSVILPVLKKLEVALSSSDCDSQVMVELKDKMMLQLSQGYSKKVHRELLLISSLLDPRFKDLKFVEQWEQEMAYDLLKQSATNMNTAMNTVVTVAKETEADSPQDNCIKIEIDNDHEFSSCSSEEASAMALLVDQLDQISKPVKRRRHAPPQREVQIHTDPMNDWLADVVQEIVPSEKQEDSVMNEISRYKSEMQILSTSSPLSWWRDRLKTYPILSHVAKKYACSPAILSDRDETRQSIYERQRASLSESNLEMMVFLNANMSLSC